MAYISLSYIYHYFINEICIMPGMLWMLWILWMLTSTFAQLFRIVCWWCFVIANSILQYNWWCFCCFHCLLLMHAEIVVYLYIYVLSSKPLLFDLYEQKEGEQSKTKLPYKSSLFNKITSIRASLAALNTPATRCVCAVCVYLCFIFYFYFYRVAQGLNTHCLSFASMPNIVHVSGVAPHG